MGKQFGGIWLGSALILLLLVVSAGLSLAVFLTGGAEQLLWRQQSLTLQAELESDMTDTLALLYLAPEWPADVPSPAKENIVGAKKSALNKAQIWSASLALSRSAGDFSASLQLDVVRFPLLLSVPPAPLIINTTLHTDAAFTLYLPSTGRHPDYLYSLWSAKLITLTSAQITCAIDVIDESLCYASPLSSKLRKEADIVDNNSDIALPVLDYLFANSLDGSQISDYRSLAWYQLPNCDGIPDDAVFVWISGNCELTATTVIGSTDKPVLLVIENGHLLLSGDTRIHGLVVSLVEDTGFSQKILMTGTSLINGSVVTNHTTTADSKITVKYDYHLLSRLQNDARLQQMLIVPGSIR